VPNLAPRFHRVTLLALTLLVASALTLSPGRVTAQTSTPISAPQTLAELEQRLRAVLEKYHVPGAGVVLVSKEAVLWLGALGIADHATNTPVTPETRFRIGSVSKTFVGLAALKLVEAGQLNLTDRLAVVAPEVAFDNPWEAQHPVRLVNLLEHTSGFTDLHLSDFARSEPDITLVDGLALTAKSRQLSWAPDRYFVYSSVGTAAAAYMIEKATGQRFEDYVQAILFDPLGMTSATYFYPSDNQLATSYDLDGETPLSYLHVIVRPAGSVNATPRDMGHFLQFILNRGQHQGMALLTPASIQRMERPTTSLGAQRGAMLGYGLDVQSQAGRAGFTFLGHTGSVDGFLAQYGYLPEQGVGYFFAINAPVFAAKQEIDELVQAYLVKDLPRSTLPPTVSTPAEALASYAGYYEPVTPLLAEWDAGFAQLLLLVQVQPQNDRLLATPLLGGTPTELLPLGEGLFRSPEAPAADGAFTTEADGALIFQTPTLNLRRVATGWIWLRLGGGMVCGLLMVSALLYALFWIPRWVWQKIRKQSTAAGLSLRVFPLFAVMSLLGALFLLVTALSGSEASTVANFGQPSVWAVSLTGLTWLFALFSLVGVVQVARLWRNAELSRSLRWYALLVSLANLTVLLYLARFGFIGVRLWA